MQEGFLNTEDNLCKEVTKMKPCDICGIEKEDWLPFVEFEGKTVCAMCFKLAIGFYIEKDKLKERGFYIRRGGKCDCCGQIHDHNKDDEEPLFGIMNRKYCPLCIIMAIDTLQGGPLLKGRGLIGRPDKIIELVENEELQGILLDAALREGKGYNA